MTTPTPQQTWSAMTPDELEQRRAAAHERDQQQVAALLALSPHEAARWLAKWLITTDVKRGYSEQMIALGHQGYGGSMGEVSVESGRKIRVRAIGAPPTWKDYPAGYDHEETFSLHALYEELRAEFFAPARPHQMNLWNAVESEATAP